MHLRVAFVALAFAATAAPAAAQSWVPSKTVEIVVGAGAGGGNDRTARSIQRIMQERKLVPATLLVINKPGAGGGIAQTYLNQHAGDPNLFMVTNPALITNNLTGFTALNYNDVTPIAQLFTEYVMIAVKADGPIKSGRDMFERLRKDPAALSIAVAPGAGAGTHIGAALAMKVAGIEPKALRIIPYSTAGEAMAALVGGHVDLMPSTALNVLPQLKAGRVRVIGVASPKRLRGDYANTPTWREQGVDVVFGNWRGVVAAKGLKDEQIAYWDDTFRKLNDTDEWKAEIAASGGESIYMGSRDTRKFLAQEYDTLRRIVNDLGLGK
ncbi:MAG: tripartite tricarboxylate transporter substrate binding protein [Burkholderiales bacterium]